VALLGVLLVLLLGVRPLIKALKRSPAAAADADSDDDPASAEDAEGRPRPALKAGVDPAELGQQLGLAQRIAAERPDDAVLALREMLNHAPQEEAA
jgi:flagellar M-ring protein FliF